MGAIIACGRIERERQIESEAVSESANKKINRKRDHNVCIHKLETEREQHNNTTNTVNRKDKPIRLSEMM